MPVLNIWLKILDFCSRPKNKDKKKEINSKFDNFKKDDMIGFMAHE